VSNAPAGCFGDTSSRSWPVRAVSFNGWDHSSACALEKLSTIFAGIRHAEWSVSAARAGPAYRLVRNPMTYMQMSPVCSAARKALA